MIMEGRDNVEPGDLAICRDGESHSIECYRRRRLRIYNAYTL